MKKALIADDAPVDLQQLERILSDAGWIVVTAADGDEAVAKAKTENPSLIMLDVNMPKLDGFSAARQLSNDPATKRIPLYFVTGKEQKADRVFAQMLGARGYITKPYTRQQIIEALDSK